jgi:hypothetical protein
MRLESSQRSGHLHRLVVSESVPTFKDVWMSRLFLASPNNRSYHKALVGGASLFLNVRKMHIKCLLAGVLMGSAVVAFKTAYTR